MARGTSQVEHILRRAAFGPTAADLPMVLSLPPTVLTTQLLDYEFQPDEVDSKIGDSAYVSVTTRGQFSPNTNIEDARQRWLFRMVHSERPLQEKMALFWHNHFATAYTKIAGVVGGVQATLETNARPPRWATRVQRPKWACVPSLAVSASR